MSVNLGNESGCLEFHPLSHTCLIHKCSSNVNKMLSQPKADLMMEMAESEVSHFLKF